MTITDIIRNEIADLLNRDCTKDDIDIFMPYIHDAIAEKINNDKPVYLSDIEAGMLDCRRANYYQCPDCFEWHTPENWNEYKGKCLNCEPYPDPDADRVWDWN